MNTGAAFRRDNARFESKKINWLFCPTCNELEITPKEKGVVTRLISNFSHATCPQCRSVYSPLIVPPTFYKDLNNVFLATIWNRTDIALRNVKHVIFCGYLFPDADIHIKYLVKRAQTNRDNELKFTSSITFQARTRRSPSRKRSVLSDSSGIELIT